MLINKKNYILYMKEKKNTFKRKISLLPAVLIIVIINYYNFLIVQIVL